MITFTMTEDEVASLMQFLRANGVDACCTQSHPLCFILRRLEQEEDHLIPQRSAGAQMADHMDVQC